jgi:hypothetical protein
MLLIKKIDCYGQLILVSCSLLSIPIFYFLGLGIGLFLLGCWQLISALGNTPGFIHTGYKKQILLYWTFCIVNLSLIAALFLFENDLSETLLMIIFWIAIGTALFITGYYLRIYYRLIDLLSLRNELDGLTKSKH